MKVGDTVTTKTPAGLQLADVPTDGDYHQKQNVTCVFKGTGKILMVKYITIDYDSWPGSYEGIGKVRYYNCLVKCDAGIGWAGMGALIKVS